MPIDKLRAMQAFVSIVDEGSMTAAARALNLSLPSVVRLLAGLEQHLEARLLNRTTRSLRLTEEGRAYLERSRAVLASVDEAEAALRVCEAEPYGALAVTAPLLLGQMKVAPAVRRFVQRYDKVRCRLLLLDRLVNLVEEQVDVGIRIGHLADSTLVSRQIGSVRRVVVGTPELLERHGSLRHPAELRRANCLSAGRPWLFSEEGREFALQLHGNFDCNVVAPVIEACLEGQGFGSFLSYQVEPHVVAGRLRVVLQKFECAPLPLCVIYPQARLLPQRTKLFIEWMRGELAPGAGRGT